MGIGLPMSSSSAKSPSPIIVLIDIDSESPLMRISTLFENHLCDRRNECYELYMENILDTHFSTLLLSVMLLISSGGESVSSKRSWMHGGDSRLYGAMFQFLFLAPNFVYKIFEWGTGCSFFWGIFFVLNSVP